MYDHVTRGLDNGRKLAGIRRPRCGRSGRGPSLTVTQRLWASAAGGADALLGRATLVGLAADDGGLDRRRLEVRFGYGFPAFGDRFTATPEIELGLSNEAREYSLGWKLGLVRGGAASLDLGLAATLREPANDNGPGSAAGAAPEYGVMLRLQAAF